MCTSQALAAEKKLVNFAEFYSDRIRISVLSTIWDRRNMMLLELYYLTSLLCAWKLKEQKFVEKRCTTSVLMR